MVHLGCFGSVSVNRCRSRRRPGVLGSLFTIVWRIVGDAVRRRRERKGLLTLLARDFELYEQLWEDFENHQSWVVRVPDHLLSTKVWEDNRARISQLLKNKEFMDMVRLFQNIDVLKEVRKRPDIWPEFLDVEVGDETGFGQDFVTKGLPFLKKQTAVVKEHIRKHVSEEDLKGSLEVTIRSLY